MDYGPPIQLLPLPGNGGVLKIKRGGTGKISNSGTEKKRVRPPVAAIRDAKSGKHLPWPPRGRVIWDPRDPFIIAYRKAHPVVEATWRRRRGEAASGMRHFDIETRSLAESLFPHQHDALNLISQNNMGGA